MNAIENLTVLRGVEEHSEPGYLPPHSLEAEQSLLGGLMLDNAMWDEVADRLTPIMFYRQEHCLVFQAIQQLAERDQPMDVVTISEALEQVHQLDQAGGLAFLAELARNTPSATNVVAYAEIVRDRHALRQLVHTCFTLNQQALNAKGRPAAELIEEAEQKLFALSEDKHERLSSVKEMLGQAINAIDRAFNVQGGVTGLPSGLAELDAMTAGWQPGDLIILAGRPSMGKTAMGLGFAEHALTHGDAGDPIFVFSLEMPEEQLMLRLIASLGNVSLQKLRTGKMGDDDWPRVTAAVNRLTQLEGRLFIDDTCGISASNLKARARRMMRRYGRPALILVDYLQLLQEPGSENRTLEVGKVSRILKETAKELCTPVMALSQLNRSLETRPNKRPCMADLRDSGALEQDADVIAFVYRDEVYHPENEDSHGLAELIIGKQRNGPTGTVHLAFLGESARFAPLAPHNREVTA
jgi:replicative DNA helicase